MKYIYGILGVSLLLVHFAPQAQETAQYHVSYDCIFNLQFDRQQLPVPYHASLVSAGGKAFFAAARDKQFELPDDEEFRMEPDTLMQLVKIPASGEMIFQIMGFSGKPVSFRDTLHAINWLLTGDQKRIDSLLCYKATAWFRGRNYIAWYAPSIPVPDGPWKLDGLPGLIIEAYEEKKDLYFLARSIRFNTTIRPLPEISNPSRYPGFPDYITYLRNFLESIQGSMAAQGSGNCLECQTQSRVKLHTWEKVID
jgi:GLPGLI family protein